MSGEDYTQVADDALADVLGETPSEEAAAPEHSSDPAPVEDDFDALAAATAEDPATALAVDEPTHTLEPLCDADTARDLVSQVRQALEQFDNAIQAIIRLRAWEPLGYDNPREFVLAEFGPTDDPDTPGRVSRVHAYRLARLAMFMYGLSTRLGDEAAALELSERALRSLPSKGGETDLAVLERVEQRVSELGYDPSPEEAQRLLDEELAKARDEIAEHGHLRGKDDDGDDDFDEDRLAGLGIDPDDLIDDPHPSPEDGDGGFDLDDLTEAPVGEDQAESNEQGASRNDLAQAYGSPLAATGEALEKTQHLASLTRGLQSVAGVEALLPGLIDYADEQEIADLADLAKSTVKVAEALIKAAEERAGELALNDGDF